MYYFVELLKTTSSALVALISTKQTSFVMLRLKFMLWIAAYGPRAKSYVLMRLLSKAEIEMIFWL